MRELLLLLFLTVQAQALVSVGTFVPYFGTVQEDEDGGTQRFEVNPYIGLNHTVPVYGNIFFNPEIGMAFHTDTQESYSKRTLLLHYNFSYRLKQTFLLFGLANIITKISGDGGTYVDESGGVNTGPTNSSTSYTTAFSLGTETFISTDYAIKMNVHVMQFLDSDKRKVNYLLTLNYYGAF